MRTIEVAVMPHTYRCPICRSVQQFDADKPRPYLQPHCLTPRCFGRLIFEGTTPGPVPPPLPPVPTAGSIAAATAPDVFTVNGSFCSYTLREDPAAYRITFSGHLTASPATTYQFDLSAGVDSGYEIPSWEEQKRGDPISHRFLKGGDSNFVFLPAMLQENHGKSVGHGRGFAKPLRLQIGRQDPNEHHSGSGLIHVMFSHNKTDLQGLRQLLMAIVNAGQLGAVFQTVAEEYGFHRTFFLSRAKNPYCLVLENRPEYYRLITVYRITLQGSEKLKFRRQASDYRCLYSWDPAKY